MNNQTTVKVRGRQYRPTRAEIRAAWDRLRTAADHGDIQASAALIALAASDKRDRTAINLGEKSA